MSKIAVDVVLLPDETIANKARAINQALVDKYGPHIVLDETHLPHISLAMGCIETSDIESAGEALAAVAGECAPGELTITGVATTLNARGQQVSSLILAQTQPLQRLHEQVMTKMLRYLTYDVTADMLFGDEDIAESSLAWIRTYPEKAAFKAFFPHITLGYGMVSAPITFPLSMAQSRLAVCHLGNHCTCRKVLLDIDC